jgi:GNAT superfamily N-acetyltransferase
MRQAGLKASDRDVDVKSMYIVKRLYVRPAACGMGLGGALATSAIERAPALGYREAMLDTLRFMLRLLRFIDRLVASLCRHIGIIWFPGSSKSARRRWKRVRRWSLVLHLRGRQLILDSFGAG